MILLSDLKERLLRFYFYFLDNTTGSLQQIRLLYNNISYNS